MPANQFGPLLKQLRKRAGMTQRELAAAAGYSDSLISSLETAQRLPDITAVAERIVPALGLEGEPHAAAALIEQAALARGECPPLIEDLPYSTRDTVHESHVPGGSGLPAPPVEITGRGAEVAQLRKRLLDQSCRLLTLVAPPGVGKTTLALAVASLAQYNYEDGASFVPLATVSDPLRMSAAILSSVAPGDLSSRLPKDRLVELLRHRALLLVLDNLEQIEGARSVIMNLLAECPNVTILATSQRRLQLRAEQRFNVRPLKLADAVDLFVQRARAVDEGFRLTDENQSAVAAICARLDNLPLALELCAAQVEVFTPVQLLNQIQADPLDLLVDGAQDLPLRQRTLRSAVERSYVMLKPEVQTLLRPN